MKKIDTTPFDLNKLPPKQNLFLMPLIWFICFVMTRRGRLKITKVRMKGLKPPFLVLSNHLAFMDFYVAPLLMFPYRANYVSELEGFEAYGEWIYRQAGCLGTRKFVNDMALIKNIKRVMARKGILVLYPEARYANVGTSSKIEPTVAKLAKMLGVPLVAVHMKGNYLGSPIWNLKTRKGVRLEATVTQLFTADEIKNECIKNIHSAVSEALSYDEYAWQYNANMKIAYPKRAEGLHMVLYMCPVCSKEFSMASENADIYCENCHSRWHMTEYGRLEFAGEDSETFTHIPDWYEWQRSKVHKAIDAGNYSLNTKVRVESLPNAVNFIDLGEGVLRHEKEGFYLTFTEYGERTEKVLFFAAKGMSSIHTEYNYRNKGQCVTLSTVNNTYFLFPKEAGFNVTKIQFATEYMFGL